MATRRIARVRTLATFAFAFVLAVSIAPQPFAWAASASEATEARVRVLVRVATPDDRALVERVRGQVSDLELELELVEDGRAFDDARALAAVWFTRPEPNADRIVVRVTDFQRGRTLVRDIGDGGRTADGALSSGTLEAAALVVREALREMATAPPAPPEQRAPATPAKAAPPRPEATPARVSFRGDAAWNLVFDGSEIFRRQGLGLGLGVKYRELELGLFAGSSLPASERDRYGSIRLRRQVLGVRGGVEWQASDSVALGLGFRAGLALYARSTENPGARTSPTKNRTNLSALLGPELRFGFAPGAGPFELTLSAGLDSVPSAPRLGYRVDGRFEPALVISRVQPVVGLGVALRTERDP